MEEEEEESIKALEDEFQLTKEELKGILYDIRTFIMDATTPIPNDLEKERLTTLLDESNFEKREALLAQRDSRKGASNEKGAPSAEANLEGLNVIRAHIDPERG